VKKLTQEPRHLPRHENNRPCKTVQIAANYSITFLKITFTGWQYCLRRKRSNFFFPQAAPGVHLRTALKAAKGNSPGNKGNLVPDLYIHIAVHHTVATKNNTIRGSVQQLQAGTWFDAG
jgi:hypothetical protein